MSTRDQLRRLARTLRAGTQLVWVVRAGGVTTSYWDGRDRWHLEVAAVGADGWEVTKTRAERYDGARWVPSATVATVPVSSPWDALAVLWDRDFMCAGDPPPADY